MQNNLPTSDDSNHANISANASIYTEIGFKMGWDIGGFQNIPFMCLFIKFQVRNTPILWFHEIGFKIPIFFVKSGTQIRSQVPQKSRHWDLSLQDV